MRRFQEKPIVLFDGQGEPGWSNAIFVGDWRHKKITVSGGAGTVKFATSDGASVGVATAPTLSSAAAYNNLWDYDRARNKNSGEVVTSDTGEAISGTVEQYILEDDSSRYFALQLSAYTSGAFYAHLQLSNDDE